MTGEPSSQHVRRFGDPSAPRFASGRTARIVALVIVVLVLVPSAFAAAHFLQSGDPPHRIGTQIGLGFGGVLVLGLIIGWWVYWWPLTRSIRSVRAREPESLVLGARVPNIASSVESGPGEVATGPIGPQRVVLRVDSGGVALLTTARTIGMLRQIPWEEIGGVEPVEYVESGVAYEGLAVEGAKDRTDIVLQMVSPGVIVRFPRGKSLAAIASDVDARRPVRG